MSVADQNGRLIELLHGSHSTVTFSPQLANQILESLQRAALTGADVAGLLFGQVESDLSEVQSFKASLQTAMSGRLSAAAVEDVLAASRKDPQSATSALIGWYALRPTSGLHENDLAFHNRYFLQANGIALILRLEQNATVLFEIYRNSGRNPLSQQEYLSGSLSLTIGSLVKAPIEVILGSKTNNDLYLRAYDISRSLDRAEKPEAWLSTAARSSMQTLFRQRPKKAADQEPVRPSPLAQAAAASAVSSGLVRPAAHWTAQPTASPTRPPAANSTRDHERPPDPPRESAPQIHAPPVSSALTRPRKPNLVLLPSILIAALAAVAIASFFYRTSFPRETATTLAGRPSTLPGKGLELRVQGQGDRVLLTWDHANPVVRSSRGGILHIDDGVQHRDIPLDPSQLQSGSILYRLGSDDVSFRLEVQRQEGAALVETMRVLDGVKIAPPQETAPRHFATRAPAATPRISYPAQALSQDRPVSSARETRPTLPIAAPASHPPAISHSDAAERTVASSVTPPNLTSSAPPPPRHVATEAVIPPTPRLLSNPSKVTNEAPKPPTLNASREKIPQSVAPRVPPTIAPSPSINKGTIQNPSSSFLPPRPIRQVSPDLRALGPAFAVSLDSRVNLVVKVNSEGRVTEAHVINKGHVPPALAYACLAAAKQWSFSPATLGGKNTSGFYTLEFNIHATGR